jgi:hypothetical protein
LQRLLRLVSSTLDLGLNGLRVARAVGYFEDNAEPEVVTAVAQTGYQAGYQAELIRLGNFWQTSRCINVVISIR